MINKFKRTIKDNFIALLFIFIISLTPLLWFKPGMLITGTDVDFPVFPTERFIERTYTWYSKILSGTDRSNNTASLPYIGTSAVYEQLGFSLINVEKLTFITWLLLSGLGMYFLISIVLYDKEGDWVQVAKVLSPVLYMVNYYNVFIWVRLQLAITTLFLFPVFFGLLIGVIQKKIPIPLAVLILSISTFISGPIGIQPPLIFAMFSAFILYTLIYSFLQLLNRNYKEIARSFLILFLLSFVFFLSSAYWSFTLLSFIFNAGYSDASVGSAIYSVDSLLNWTSSVTGFLNVFRFFGDVPWFDGWGGESYSPEFLPYTQNIVLILFSFALPVLVFIPLFTKKFKRNFNIRFFTLLALIGLFLSKGTHEPFGFVFEWMIKNVPFFWIHRAPWQKFTIITSLSFAVLGGISLSYVYEKAIIKVKVKKKLQSFYSYLFIAAIIFLILGYNYVFVLGSMFPGKEGEDGFHQKFDLGFHHEIPEYIFDTREFLLQDSDSFKILSLPEDRTNVYDWGYAGSTDIASVVLTKDMLSPQYGEGFAPNQHVEKIHSKTIEYLYKGSQNNIADYLGFLNIKYILLRNDFRYDFFGDTDSPSFIQDRISLQNNVHLANSSGKWDLYAIPQEKIYPMIYAPRVKYNYFGQPEDIIGILNNSDTSEPRAYYTTNSTGQSTDYIVGKALPVINLNEDKIWMDDYVWPEANVRPGSLIYKAVKIKEWYEKKKTENMRQQITKHMWFAVKRIQELKQYKDLPDNVKNQLINDYIKDMDISNEILKNTPSVNRDVSYWNSVRNNLAYMQRSINMLTESDIELNKEVIASYERMMEWYDTNSALSCRDLCYQIDLLSDGEFNLLFLNEYLYTSEDLFPFELIVKDAENGQVVTQQVVAEHNTNDLQLKSGSYIFEIIRESSLADYDENSAKISEDELKSIEIDEIHDTLVTNKVSHAYYFEIQNWSNMNRFQLDLEYSIEAAEMSKVIILEEDNEGNLKILVQKSLNGVFGDCNEPDDADCAKKQNIEFTTSANSVRGHAYIYSYTSNSKANSLVLNDFTTKKAITSRILLKRTSDPVLNAQPEIEFYRKNPTKYIVSINNAPQEYDLVLGQSFHNGWKVYYNQNEQIIDTINTLHGLDQNPFETLKLPVIAENSHKIANGYANSWTINSDMTENRASYSLVIEFYPQRIFYIGLIVSFATIITSFAVWIGNKFYAKKSSS